MKSLIKYLVVHVLCGILAVYLAGVADKQSGQKGAPINFIFLTGPLGLMVATVGVIVTFNYKLTPLVSIYNKGYGN